MSITAKELAKILDISEAAVSMALNGKPGISTETRKLVIETAHNYSYDFTKIKKKKTVTGTINYVIYRKTGAVLRIQTTDFFDVLFAALEKECKAQGYRFITINIVDEIDIAKQLEQHITSDCVGILLQGTEMQPEDFFAFAHIPLPIVVIDTYYNSAKMDCVLMNNAEGSYQATRYLIKKLYCQPGYLHSSFSIHNFESRADGYYRALREGGFSSSNAIVHLLSPSMEGAYTDMLNLIKNGCPLASAYFADNDLIAAGAMKAFKECGYRIPEDIAIIGFDNVPLCTYLEPNLTSVNVPIRYMAKAAVQRLVNVIGDKDYRPIKIEVNTNLIKRKSV